METKVAMNDLLNGAFNNSADNSGRLVRNSGSYIVGGPTTGNAVMQMLMGANWEEVTGEVVMQQASFGACRYFRAKITEGQGVMSVSSLDGLFRAATGMGVDKWDTDTQGAGREALKSIGQEILGRCKLVWGEHGPEIVTDLDAVQVDHMVLIVGDPENPETTPDPASCVIYTWHPGMPCAPGRISSATIKLG